MDKEKQHFVPKTYLKHFCADEKDELFQASYIEFQRKWSSPKIMHINSICYKRDFYNLSPEFANRNGIESNFVERNAFWYENRFLDILIKKLESGTELSQSDIEKLPSFYLSMITRNPVFMARIDPAITRNVLDKYFGRIRNVEDKSMKEWADQIENKFRNEFTQQKVFSAHNYKLHTGSSPVFNGILNKINGYKIMIGKFSDPDSYFITSDSPGFTLCNKGDIYSFKFQDDAYHYLPISSKFMIALIHPVYAIDAPKFSIVEVPSETMNFINKGTIKARSKYVYCENKVFLEKYLTNTI